MSKLVYGVGINDADYCITSIIDGKLVKCKYYASWHHMLERCYSLKWSSKYKTYSDCTVCEHWLYFSNFKTWMEKQDWEGKQLDKDILSKGNKIYSPDTCVFVTQNLNKFLTDSGASRKNGQMIGAKWHSRDLIYEASCNNPFSGKREYLGRFEDELSAHIAWKNRKHELACMWAELQEDSRVADALISRYS